MRKKPERVAWTVLSIAFATFWLLAIGTPLGIRSIVVNTRETQPTQMQVIGGTVLVQKARGGEPIGVTRNMVLEQGDEVITDATSSATLDLFDRSHVIVYGNTDVKLERTQSPRFRPSSHPNEIVLNLTGGFIRVGVAFPGERSTSFRVVTPHTEIELSEGSYQIEALVKMFRYYEQYGFWGNPRVLGWLLGRPPTTFAAFVERITEIPFRGNVQGGTSR